MGEITEQRFVELMEQIPVMAEKLDRIMSFLDHIQEHGLLGVRKDDEASSPFEVDSAAFADDQRKMELIQQKKREVEKLMREANELERELDADS